MRMFKGDENAVTLAEQGVEVWLPVKDCPDRYFVSNLGRVCSHARGRSEVLKHTLSRAGYPTVGIYARRGERADTRLVHRMVVEAFVGEPPTPAHTDVRHLNGLHADVRLCNLKWGTRSENMRDVWDHHQAGVQSPVPEHGSTWFKDRSGDIDLVRVCLRLRAEGVLTIGQVALILGCSNDYAGVICAGETSRPLDLSLVQPRKPRRTKQRRDEIAALAGEGLGFKEINERLNETLTAQDVYYYRLRGPKK